MRYYDEDTVYELMRASGDCATAYEFGVHKSVDINDYPHIEIPDKHGRLVDADNLIDDFKKYMCGKCYVINRAGVACEDCFYRDIEKAIAIAPTVLEASN